MNNMETDIELDSIVTSVINKIKSRAIVGFEKYGTNMDRSDLSLLEWITHCQEELMDGMIYLEKIKNIIHNKNSQQ